LRACALVEFRVVGVRLKMKMILRVLSSCIRS
jgi:hypothetical protein